MAGKSVEIAGTKDFNRKLGVMLRAAGAAVKETEAIRIINNPEGLCQDLTGYSWITLTSPNGVRALAQALALRGSDLSALNDIKTACVGPGTANMLAEFGCQADLVPKSHSAAGLAEELAAILKEDDRVLLIQGETASPDLADGLWEAGISHDSCVLYRTEEVNIPEQGDIPDFIVFSSALAANAYLRRREVPATVTVICMGKKAAEAAAAQTDAVIKVTKQSDLHGLCELILLSGDSEQEGK